MAIQPRVSRLRVINGVGGWQEFITTADVQDAPGGSVVNLSVVRTTSGVAPSGTFTATVKTDTGVVVINLGTLTNGLAKFFSLTHNGESIAGSGQPRSGTVEVVLRSQSSNVGEAHDISSDGTTNTQPAGWTNEADRGWIRGTTTATLTPSLVNAAYGEQVSLTLDLADPLYMTRALTLALGPDSGASNVVADGHVRTVDVDNTFPAASTIYTPSVTVPNPVALATGVPYTVLTVTTQNVTVDPRMTVQHHMQLNNNVYDAAKHRLNRLASDLGFVTATFLNAKGAALPGLTVHETMRDEANLVAPAFDRSVVTDAAGRLTLVAWDRQLPVGAWCHAVDVTAPAGATGLEANPEQNFLLLSRSPWIGAVMGGGPVGSEEGDHFHPGDVLQVGVAMVHFELSSLLVPDTDNPPQALLGRFTAGGHVEYLEDDYVTWTTVSDAVPANWLTLYRADLVLPGASDRVYITQIPANATATWTEPVNDLFVLGRAFYGGVPYVNFSPVPVLAKEIRHNYALLKKLV